MSSERKVISEVARKHISSAAEIVDKIGLGPNQVDMQADLQATIDKYHQYNLPSEFYEVLHLEKSGGPCPRCGTPWNRIDVDYGPFRYHYFDPDCDCFPRCPECGTSWHREVAAGNQRLDKCTSCGWAQHPVYVRICRACNESFRTDRSDDHYCGICEEKRKRQRRVS